MTVPEDTAELWRIYLRPEYWCCGFGEELLSWGIYEIKKTKIETGKILYTKDLA